MNVGAIIKELRNREGWSQGELSSRCGWTSNNNRISGYETGNRVPDIGDIETMAGVFGLTLAQFFTPGHGGNAGIQEGGGVYTTGTRRNPKLTDSQFSLLQRLESLFESGDLTDSDAQAIRGYIAALITQKN